MQSDLGLARMWMKQMGDSAQKYGLTIQWVGWSHHPVSRMVWLVKKHSNCLRNCTVGWFTAVVIFLFQYTWVGMSAIDLWFYWVYSLLKINNDKNQGIIIQWDGFQVQYFCNAFLWCCESYCSWKTNQGRQKNFSFGQANIMVEVLYVNAGLEMDTNGGMDYGMDYGI